VASEVLLVKEDIDNGWLFATNVDFEDDANICDIATKCKYLLMEF
jgi:hypothetical protein